MIGFMPGANFTGNPYAQNSMPSSQDPDALLAYMTRQDAVDYENDFGQFERDLVERARTDTSLIDSARTDAPQAAEMFAGITKRNQERYGVSLTPAQMKALKGGQQRSSALGQAQAVNNARLAQTDLNQSLLGSVIDVGQGVYKRSMDGLSSAASNRNALENQYRQAKAASKAQTYSTLGMLGAAAILAI
jgi:hypothetical protein